MALYLYLGPSGAGKSYELNKMITEEAAKDFDRNFLLVVPEQFTLQTQRDMIAMSPTGGIMNIDVLSFPRMAHRIFEELGVKTPVTLEDTGKTMIVKKVALDRADRLGIYAGKVHRRGFIDEMKSLISEFYQYGIGPDELERMLVTAQSRPQLEGKLRDISVIYDGFREFISGRFIMNEELLQLFVENAPRSRVLKGAAVCFDGFTGFTVMQLKCIECLMEIGCDVHVTVTIDPADADKLPDEEDLFCLSEKTVEKLTRLADGTGTDIIKRIIAPEIPPRFKNAPDVAALERSVFRRKRQTYTDHGGIRLVSCESPAAEIRFAICEIRRLVSQTGCRYGDIGIITGDANLYGRLAEREFAAAGIPYFVDAKKNILGTAPVEFIRAALEIAERDYAYESVFRFLKTGLTGIGEDDIVLLENYCASRAIRGRGMWKKTWTGKYRGRYAIDLDRINAIRERVIAVTSGPLETVAAKNVKVSDRIEAIKTLLKNCEVYERLEKEAEEKKESPVYEVRLEGLEAAQLQEKIEAVFERICLLLGDDIIDPSEFSDILETGFSEAKLALIPQGSDSVVLGDMERTRFTSVKALFLLGCNDGLIPASGGDAGLLSDADRSIFAENDIELSPTKRQSAYLNEFYLYLNLTKPTERLYLSYHRMTADKKPGRPSYVFGKLMKMFAGLRIKDIFADDPEVMLGSDRGRRTAADLIRERQPKDIKETERQLLYEVLTRDKGLYGRLVDAAFRKRLPERITPESAEKLYGRMLVGSVSMLESFAECAFKHFLKYGLRLDEPREYAVGGLELGNIYHKALENYCEILKKSGRRWHDTERAERENIEKTAIEGAFDEYADILSDSKRNEYIRRRVARVLDRTIETLDAQIKAGAFEPAFFEKGFKHAGEFMSLTGKIDRMDVCEKDGKKVLRVVDYKSGKKDFNLSKLFYGLQIQLAVYMQEGMKELGADGEKPEFSGMYYYNIDDPVIDGGINDDVGDKITMALRMKGPSQDGGKMLRLHDEKLADADGVYPAGSYRSPVIPAEISAKGELTKNTKVMSPEQFEKIGEYVEHKMRTEADAILAGRVDTDPYEEGSLNPCAYCPYGGVCGFDCSLGDRYRKLKKFSSEDEVWEKIDGALNSEA
jgi:ATP-dependent helicase/nuclease subunit B